MPLPSVPNYTVPAEVAQSTDQVLRAIYTDILVPSLSTQQQVKAQLDTIIVNQQSILARQDTQIQRMDQSSFLNHTSALCLGLLVGMFTWRLIVLAKNQRSLW